MNSEYIFAFHNCFLFKTPSGALEFKMNVKLQEIRKKIAKLEKEADDLRRLKADYQIAKEFRRMIIKPKND